MSGTGGACNKKAKLKNDANHDSDDEDDDDTGEEATMCQQDWRPDFWMVGPYKNDDGRDCVRFGIDISGKNPAECQIQVKQQAYGSQLFVTAPASKGWLSLDRLYGHIPAEKQNAGYWNCFQAHKQLLTTMTGAKGRKQLTAVFTVPFKARDCKANPSSKAIVSKDDGTVFLWIDVESWVEPVQAAKDDVVVYYY